MLLLLLNEFYAKAEKVLPFLHPCLADWNQVFTEATIGSNGDPLASSLFYVTKVRPAQVGIAGTAIEMYLLSF